MSPVEKDMRNVMHGPHSPDYDHQAVVIAPQDVFGSLPAFEDGLGGCESAAGYVRDA